MSTTTATSAPLANPVALKTTDPYTALGAGITPGMESQLLAAAGGLFVIGLFLLLVDLRMRRARRYRKLLR